MTEARLNLGQKELKRLNWFGAKSVIGSVIGSRFLNPIVHAAGKLILPQRIRMRLPLRRKRVTYRLMNAEGVALLDPLHDIVARDIYWGRFKPTSRAEQRKLRCLELLSHDCSTFIDIGAYSGICALVAARANPLLRAIAYEIVPQNYLLLVRNIIENDLVDRVEARLRGVGNADEVLRLPVAVGLSSNPTSMSLGSRFHIGVGVRIVPLDAEIGGLAGPFLVKLDVEGYEPQVIQGAAKFVESHRPDIICEVLPGAQSACEFMQSALRCLGYRWFEIEEEGIVERSAISPAEMPKDWLFSARPEVVDVVRMA